MNPRIVLLLAVSALAWLPGRAAWAQSEVDPGVAACLNSTALSDMQTAGANPDTAKTGVPTAPRLGGADYVAFVDGLYALSPDQLRYRTRTETGEPLFAVAGPELGAPGSLFMLGSVGNETRGCGFIRFILRDRWMETYRKGDFQELIDRASVSYEDGAFKFLMIAFGDYRRENPDPEHVYDLYHMTFTCPGRLRMRYSFEKAEDDRTLWSGNFVGTEDWQDDLPMDRVAALQRFFCESGAGSDTAAAFPDVPAALAAWRAENQR